MSHMTFAQNTQTEKDTQLLGSKAAFLDRKSLKKYLEGCIQIIHAKQENANKNINNVMMDSYDILEAIEQQLTRRYL